MAKPEKEIQFDFTKTEKELNSYKKNEDSSALKSIENNIDKSKNNFWDTDLEDIKKRIKKYELNFNSSLENKKNKNAKVYGYLTAIVGLLGLMFSINYAGWLIFAGLFYKNQKDPEVFFWLCLGLLGSFFAIPYSGWLIFYGIIKNL